MQLVTECLSCRLKCELGRNHASKVGGPIMSITITWAYQTIVGSGHSDSEGDTQSPLQQLKNILKMQHDFLIQNLSTRDTSYRTFFQPYNPEQDCLTISCRWGQNVFEQGIDSYNTVVIKTTRNHEILQWCLWKIFQLVYCMLNVISTNDK